MYLHILFNWETFVESCDVEFYILVIISQTGTIRTEATAGKMAQDGIYHYRLPAVRFIPLINIILFVDGISTIVLWILGNAVFLLC